ncbi:MAG: lytic transglycosylase domain-containing protein [Treponema sp.]|nr:lytic transglycosylase domain-containing protein [Treponema sp.]
MKEISGHRQFKIMSVIILFLSIFIAVVSVFIATVFPAPVFVPSVTLSTDITPATQDQELEVSFTDNFVPEAKSFSIVEDDKGLVLYRNPVSRGAVEWFYMHITGNREVTLSVLEAADENDIPLSLAFALAHTESGYNIEAYNRNSNSSIDRGLFQLNNASFPNLSRDDFYDPATNAKYGLAHLRFCLNTAGNEITALAMYNAGTNKVRKNSTPQVTLNYVSKIVNYRDSLDRLFDIEVVSFYGDEVLNGQTAVIAKK